jgi:hypothetical protein
MFPEIFSDLIVEHDPPLNEDVEETVEDVTQALKQTYRETTILLYAPALDLHLQKRGRTGPEISSWPSLASFGAITIRSSRPSSLPQTLPHGSK